MISLKSEREISLMIEAGRIVNLVLTELEKMCLPGVKTIELDRQAEKIIISQGATPSFKGYGGFPGSICTSINDTLIHGIPGSTRLKEGDIISLDVGANYKGYHGDAARTILVGEVKESAKKLVEVTKLSFFEGIKHVKDGAHLGDVSHAIQTYVESFGYGIVRDYVGHGVGRALHEDPQIPNYGNAGQGLILKEGMTLAIEPMVTEKSPETYVLDDEWTVKTVDKGLTAHYENTLLVTKDGYKLLTLDEKEDINEQKR